MANLLRPQNPFVVALDFFLRWKDINQDVVADAVGYKNANMISAILTGKTSGSTKKRESIADFCGLKYHKFLEFGQALLDKGETPGILETFGISGKSNMNSTITPSPPNDIQQRKNERHHETIDRFINQPLATEINENLIKLESLTGNHELEEINEIIKLKIQMAEKKNNTGPQKNEQGRAS